MRNLNRFLHGEDGAVTVDWVVLTAAVVGLAWVVLAPIFTGTTDIASLVGGNVSSVNVGPQP